MMKKILYLLLILSLLFLVTNCASRSAEEFSSKNILSESDVPNNFILSPSFESIDGTFSAGTAFAVNDLETDNTIIITAMHLFGPDGGLDHSISANDLPSYINKATFYNAFDYTLLAESTNVILIPDAKPAPQINRDIAAFYIEGNTSISTAEIYDGQLKTGENVWLAAYVIGGAPINQLLHAAKVVESSEDILEFEFENADLDLTATSGAPILNGDGKIVGINIGSKYTLSGKLIGLANPSISFNKLLLNAVSNHKE